MPHFWDRSGKPMELLDWARHLENTEYRVLAVDLDVEKQVMVSTIWEGLSSPVTLDETHPGLIFETAILIDGVIVESVRWPTEQSAIDGHRLLCQRAIGRDPRPEDRLVQKIAEAER